MLRGKGTRGVLNTSLKSPCLLRDLRPACCWWPWHGRSNPVKFRSSAISLAMMVFSCFLLAGTVIGQDTGAIKGTVEDTTRGIVAGAQVKLRNQTTGQEVLANSDEQGEYFLSGSLVSEFNLCSGNDSTGRDRKSTRLNSSHT